MNGSDPVNLQQERGMSIDESSQWVATGCPHDCPSGCGLLVERRADGTVGEMRGNPAHPYNRGVICAKVSRYAERANHPGKSVV